MNHWLEEAEEKVHKRSHKHSQIKDRVVSKKSEVKENKNLIGEDYLDLIDQFVSIIQRINNLPRTERIPFGQITSKHKENKLDNLLHKFSSSRRISIREFSGFLAPFKTQRYKNSRSFFISVSREMGSVLLEYKEIKAKKVRLEDKPQSFFSKLNFFNRKKEHTSHEVNENIKTIPFKEFDENLLLEHIDWLAFKNEGTNFF